MIIFDLKKNILTQYTKYGVAAMFNEKNVIYQHALFLMSICNVNLGKCFIMTENDFFLPQDL